MKQVLIRPEEVCPTCGRITVSAEYEIVCDNCGKQIPNLHDMHYGPLRLNVFYERGGATEEFYFDDWKCVKAWMIKHKRKLLSKSVHFVDLPYLMRSTVEEFLEVNCSKKV